MAVTGARRGARSRPPLRGVLVAGLAVRAPLHKSRDLVGPEHLWEHLIRPLGAGVSALRSLCGVTLQNDRNIPESLPTHRQPAKPTGAPKPEEVVSIPDAVRILRDRVVLTDCRRRARPAGGRLFPGTTPSRALSRNTPEQARHKAVWPVLGVSLFRADLRWCAETPDIGGSGSLAPQPDQTSPRTSTGTPCRSSCPPGSGIRAGSRSGRQCPRSTRCRDQVRWALGSLRPAI